jgi:tetratricopeptide (TPR) repeat protein
MLKAASTSSTSRTKREWFLISLLFMSCALLFFGWVYLMFTNTGYKYPEDLVFDRQGNFYISESEQAQILKFNSKGEQLASFGGNGKGEGQFKKIWGPNRITVDSKGQLYASQSEVTYLQKFDQNGKFLGKLEIGKGIRQLLTDSQDNLYVLIYDTPYILKFDPKGQPFKSWQLQSPSQSEGQENGQSQSNLSKVNGLGLDQEDNLYVLEGQLLKKFDRQGKLVSSWAPGVALNGPLAIDRTGRVYLVGESYQIYQFDRAGQLLKSWGGEGPGKDQFSFYIRQIALDREDHLNVLSTEQGPLVVKKFDSQGHYLSRWSFGWPHWVSLPLNFSGYIMGLVVVLIFRLGLRWIRRGSAPLLNGEPLPEWVVDGQANPALLYDHLNLRELANASKQAQKVTLKSPAQKVLVLALVFLLIGWLVITMAIGLDGFSFSPLIIISGLVSGVALVVVVVAGRKLYEQNKSRQDEHQPLLSQVLGTMPAANQPLFVGSEKAIGLSANEVTNLGFYLVFYLPLAFVSLAVTNYTGAVEWFEGWPGWLIQVVIIVGLSGSLALALILGNYLQKEGQGKLKLNRAEMANFQALIWLWLFGFVVITFSLDNLNDWINSLTRSASTYSPYASPSIVSIVGNIVKYVYLLIGFFYVLDRFCDKGMKQGDYQQTLRVLGYLRGLVDVLSLRLEQAKVLMLAGRFSEAEYLLQEALNRPLYQEGPYLGRLLGSLGLLRLYEGRYAESMFLLENSIKLKPDLGTSYNTLAELYLWLGQHPWRAAELLEEAAKRSASLRLPFSRKFFSACERELNQTWALAQRGKKEEATKLLQQVSREIDPKNQPGRALLYLRGGQLKQLWGEELKALEYYHKAREVDPKGIWGEQAERLEEQVFIDLGRSASLPGPN